MPLQPCWSSWALSAWSWLVPGQPPPSCLREASGSLSRAQPLPPSLILCLFVCALVYLYFSLCLCLLVSPLCAPASWPLCLNSAAAPTSPQSSGSGLGGFLPGQRWMLLMILLIFTVSAGDQPATPAALPRCPREPVGSAAPTPAPRMLSVSGSLCSQADQIVKGGVDSTGPRTVGVWGQVCGRGVCVSGCGSTHRVLTVGTALCPSASHLIPS